MIYLSHCLNMHACTQRLLHHMSRKRFSRHPPVARGVVACVYATSIGLHPTQARSAVGVRHVGFSREHDRRDWQR